MTNKLVLSIFVFLLFTYVGSIIELSAKYLGYNLIITNHKFPPGYLTTGMFN